MRVALNAFLRVFSRGSVEAVYNFCPIFGAEEFLRVFSRGSVEAARRLPAPLFQWRFLRVFSRGSVEAYPARAARNSASSIPPRVFTRLR